MPRKTDGEKIDELEKLAAVLTERLDNVRDELKEFKRQMEEAGKRSWGLVPPVLAALLGSGLTALFTYLLRK